jgi:hypothetical protein
MVCSLIVLVSLSSAVFWFRVQLLYMMLQAVIKSVIHSMSVTFQSQRYHQLPTSMRLDAKSRRAG